MVEVKERIDNFFTQKIVYPFGDKSNYKLEDCLVFDKYEASVYIVDQDWPHPRILNIYRGVSRRLIRHAQIQPGQRVLDIYPRTGISTIELLSKYPEVSVLGVEKSGGLFRIALYKFHQADGEDILSMVNDPKLLKYWEEFREESIKYKDKVQFINEDFENVNLEPNSFDNAVANQAIHWTDLSKAFNQLNMSLKSNGQLFWTTSSHFYEDARFPTAEYGFKYNDFLKYVLDEVSNDGIEILDDYRNLSKPKHNLDSLRKITLNEGFDTELIAFYLIPVDLQVFIQNHVPAIVRQLTPKDISAENLEKIIKSAISKTINNPKALADIMHKYEMNPVFKSFRV